MKIRLAVIMFAILLSGFISKPEKAYSVFKQANSFFNKSEYNKAIEYYENGLKINEDKNIYSNLGLAYFKKNQYEKSFENYSQSNLSEIDLFQMGNINFILAENMEKIEEKIAKLEEAGHNYRQAIIDNPNDERYKFNYEYTMQILNRLKDEKKKQDEKSKDNEAEKQNPEDSQESDSKEESSQNREESDTENSSSEENEDSQEEGSSSQDKKGEDEDSKQSSAEKGGVDDEQGKEQGSEDASQNEIDEKYIKLEQAKRILKSLEQKETDDLKNNQRVLKMQPQEQNNNKMDW